MPPHSSPSPSTAALRALLGGIVDYAGLFPPAGLGMSQAVANYAAHRASAERWMLGRFVVPAARLDEFAVAAAAHLRGVGTTWRLSALVGPDTDADLARVQQFNTAHDHARAARAAESRDGVHALVDAIEAKAVTPSGVERLAATVPRGLVAYVELPTTADPEPLIDAVAAARLRAKIRTGGITADLIPSVEAVARFVTCCRDAGIAFKATAGLHHALRAEHALTYESDAPCATMHGFLNVFLAAAFLHAGGDESIATRVLREQRADAFVIDDAGAAWHDHRLTTEQLADARKRFAIGFGSCSFAEPVAELVSLGWLREGNREQGTGNRISETDAR